MTARVHTDRISLLRMMRRRHDQRERAAAAEWLRSRRWRTDPSNPRFWAGPGETRFVFGLMEAARACAERQAGALLRCRGWHCPRESFVGARGQTPVRSPEGRWMTLSAAIRAENIDEVAS